MACDICFRSCLEQRYHWSCFHRLVMISPQFLWFFTASNWLEAGNAPVDNSRNNGCTGTHGVSLAHEMVEQMKALTEAPHMSFKNLIFQVTGTVKARSNIKTVPFNLIGYRERTDNSCGPKHCQNAPQETKKVPYKYSVHTK